MRYLRPDKARLDSEYMAHIRGLWERQGFRCPICRKPLQPPFSGNWDTVTDHSHKTGEVRGILCRGCNSAVALVEGEIMNPQALRLVRRTIFEGGSGILKRISDYISRA